MGCTGAGRAPASPLRPAPWQGKGLKLGKTQAAALLFCSPPKFIPPCSCLSANASVSLRAGKAELGLLLAALNPVAGVTSVPVMLIIWRADLWEDVGSAAVPGEGQRVRGSAVPFHPFAFLGKEPALPPCPSHRSSSDSRRAGATGEGRRRCAA